MRETVYKIVTFKKPQRVRPFTYSTRQTFIDQIFLKINMALFLHQSWIKRQDTSIMIDHSESTIFFSSFLLFQQVKVHKSGMSFDN